MFQLSDTDVTLLKGYIMKRISKRMLNKETFGAGLEEIVPIDCLKNEISDVLEGNGRVYALYQKKRMVMCYLFTKTGTEKEKNETLTLSKTYIYPDVVSRVDAFEQSLEEELKELLIFYSLQEINFKEKRLVKKEYKTAKGNISGALIAFSIGMLFGIALNNMALGLCFGIAFLPLYGITWHSGTKEDRIKTEDDSSKKTVPEEMESEIEELNLQNIVKPIRDAFDTRQKGTTMSKK